jgi:hypothetical protein
MMMEEFNNNPGSTPYYYLSNADWSVGCPLLLEGVEKYQKASRTGDVSQFDDSWSSTSTSPVSGAT